MLGSHCSSHHTWHGISDSPSHQAWPATGHGPVIAFILPLLVSGQSLFLPDGRTKCTFQVESLRVPALHCQSWPQFPRCIPSQAQSGQGQPCHVTQMSAAALKQADEHTYISATAPQHECCLESRGPLIITRVRVCRGCLSHACS